MSLAFAKMFLIVKPLSIWLILTLLHSSGDFSAISSFERPDCRRNAYKILLPWMNGRDPGMRESRFGTRALGMTLRVPFAAALNAFSAFICFCCVMGK